MILTFREILRRIGARVSNTSTSTSEADDIYPKIKDWVNERYERLYDSFPWRAGLANTTLTLTASTLDYALNRDIWKILSVYDQTNGKIILESDVQSHIRFHAEDLDQTGNVAVDAPKRYYSAGDYTVKAEIGTTAEKITVLSTESGDTSPNCVSVTGLVNGVELAENITLTGTTSAESSNTYDASQKLRVSVGATTTDRKSITGVITISGATSSTVFAEISPFEYAAEYRWIRVSPKPESSGTQPTWLIWYTKRLQRLYRINDIPIIDVSLALIEGATAEAYREDGIFAEADKAEQRFVEIAREKMNADTGPNLIEQFVPRDTELIHTLDYGRVIGGGE